MSQIIARISPQEGWAVVSSDRAATYGGIVHQVQKTVLVPRMGEQEGVIVAMCGSAAACRAAVFHLTKICNAHGFENAMHKDVAGMIMREFSMTNPEERCGDMEFELVITTRDPRIFTVSSHGHMADETDGAERGVLSYFVHGLRYGDKPKTIDEEIGLHRKVYDAMPAFNYVGRGYDMFVLDGHNGSWYYLTDKEDEPHQIPTIDTTASTPIHPPDGCADCSCATTVTHREEPEKGHPDSGNPDDGPVAPQEDDVSRFAMPPAIDR